MASPQLERGHTRIADELLEAMTRFDFSKRQYKILLAVIRKTYGYQKKADVISSGQLADMTGLTSRNARTAVCELEALGVFETRLIGQQKEITLVKNYETWRSHPDPEAIPVESRLNSSRVKSTRPKTTRLKTDREPGLKRAVNPAQNEPHNKERKKKQIKPPPQKTSMDGGNAGSIRNGEQWNPREDIPPPADFDPGGGSGEFLIIPKALSRKEADSARQQVAQIKPDQRQAVLDVLSAMITAGEIRKSPLAALGGLVRRAQADTFDPSPGIHLAERRQRTAIAEVAQQRREAETKSPPPSVHDIEAARIKLKQFVNPRLVHG